MLRVAITNLVLFLLPFVVFAFYLRYGRKVDSWLSGWTTLSIALCTVAAVVLVGASLVLFESSGRGPTTGAYVPPTWQDGVLTPGHVQ